MIAAVPATMELLYQMAAGAPGIVIRAGELPYIKSVIWQKDLPLCRHKQSVLADIDLVPLYTGILDK